MRNMLVRAVSGVVLAIIVFGAILWSPWSAALLLSLIMVGCLTEFYGLCCAAGYAPSARLGTFFASFMFLAACAMAYSGYFPPTTAEEMQLAQACMMAVSMVILLIIVLIPMAFVCELWRNHPTPIANVSTTLAGVLYVALPMSLLPFIPFLLKGEWSPWALLAYILLVWSNDVFAYLAGVMCGRHRMCERISPKKTWEGFVGGLVGTIAAGVLAGYLFHSANLWLWGGLGFVVSLTGVAGDFVESLFKRSVGVKDSGNIMPGHGGFLDRFDALLISVPFAVVYVIFARLIMSVVH